MTTKIINGVVIQKDFDRRSQPTLRNHYGRVEDCYLCDGLDNCETYTYNIKTDRCAWKDIIDSDLEKITTGKGILTFPILKKVIQKYEK